MRRIGGGPPLLLLHGGIEDGEQTFPEQMALAERWTLLVPDRVGYGGSAALGYGEDFERDAALLAPVLEPGTHVLGHSSGAIAAMLLAAARPEAVASLALIEPPAFHLAPEAHDLLVHHQALFARTALDPVAFLQEFLRGLGEEPPPAEALAPLAEPIQVWRRVVRWWWEADVPLDALARAAFHKLIFSGGYDDGFEALCDTIAAAIGAERETMPGQGHEVQRNGAPFNERLVRFLRAASG